MTSTWYVHMSHLAHDTTHLGEPPEDLGKSREEVRHQKNLGRLLEELNKSFKEENYEDIYADH